MFAELDAVRPEVVVLLGATAAKSLMGNDFRLTAHRGEVLELPDDIGSAQLRTRPLVVVAAHPSAVLRGPADRWEAAFAALVSDLRCAARALDSQPTRV